MNFEIIEFEDRYHAAFKALNVAWLSEYNLLEPHDLEILNNPTGFIIDSGGVIYLVRSKDEIIASAALIQEHHGVFELVKMTVAAAYQKEALANC